jgi:hypothetical protein
MAIFIKLLTKKTFIVEILIFLIFLTSCAPSQGAIQTAIAQTNAAEPTTLKATSTPIPPTPTNTNTPTEIPTQTQTVTSTPDIRVIEIDPQNFLIKQEELPIEARYFIPNQSGMSLQTNTEIISDRGVEEGREYVINTGRITGWYVDRIRGVRSVLAPDEVYNFVGMYRTSQGAQLALLEYNTLKTNPMDGWKPVNIEMELGDNNIVYTRKEVNSGGNFDVVYVIEFTYRNFIVQVVTLGLEKDVTHEFSENVARTILTKLQNAPLVNPNEASFSITPTPKK